jgi:hypothetical protein
MFTSETMFGNRGDAGLGGRTTSGWHGGSSFEGQARTLAQRAVFTSERCRSPIIERGAWIILRFSAAARPIRLHN